jgi:hypothetical protein
MSAVGLQELELANVGRSAAGGSIFEALTVSLTQQTLEILAEKFIVRRRQAAEWRQNARAMDLSSRLPC